MRWNYKNIQANCDLESYFRFDERMKTKFSHFLVTQSSKFDVRKIIALINTFVYQLEVKQREVNGWKL